MLLDAVGCRNCAWREPCGGRGGQQNLFGCFYACHQPGFCVGLACPCQGDAYLKLVGDIGGLDARRWRPLLGPTLELPRYVPIVRHGKKRKHAFDRATVGISIRDLLPRRRPETYVPIATSAKALREQFRLLPDARIVVSSVAPDEVIEDFWSYRDVTNVIARLAKLDLALMTTPNFSFATNVARTHTLYSRKRIVITAEELSAAGIPTALHVNAENDVDWDFWFDVLSAFPAIRHVVKEFQTGNRKHPLGLWALDRMDRMQDRLGRALHPIIVGGAQYVPVLAQRFGAYTVMDSHPFMTAAHRQELVAWGNRLRKNRRRAATIDELLDRNERKYVAMLDRQHERGARRIRLRLAS